MTSRYIHTINGHMARFVTDALARGKGQICYATDGNKLKDLLVADLKTIRQQHRDTVRNRTEYFTRVSPGWKENTNTYDYIRVRV